jgi:hypothetical protein
MVQKGLSSELRTEVNSDKVNNFIAAGVACYAFALLDEIGLLDKILNNNEISAETFYSYPNPLVISAASQTLVANGILIFENGSFKLTFFGTALAKQRGSIGLIYNGYSRALANQLSIVKDQPSQRWDFIDQDSISHAAAHMSRDFINKTLIAELESCSIKGVICDLGCGNAATLLYVCRTLGLIGLGFDISESSIKTAKAQLKPDDKLTLVTQDITQISNIYPDVEVLIQAFVMHDLSNKDCRKTFESLRKSFPNVKMFLYIDAVSPGVNETAQLPGFDYVHSLFSIKPRTLAETRNIIEGSGFSIENQQSIEGLTNCYIWTLAPSNVAIKDNNL